MLLGHSFIFSNKADGKHRNNDNYNRGQKQDDDPGRYLPYAEGCGITPTSLSRKIL
jgi:hypothetical protein